MTTIDVSGLFSLDGQVAVVTGASSGLGRRFARVLHGAGATVVVAARRADRLDELAAELGDRVVVVPADMADDDSVIALAEAAEAVAGHVDVLVNNAGVGGTTPAELETMERWRSTMAVNLDGLFLLSQQVGLGMIERGHGSIVNIASILGLVGSAPIKQAAYCASKAAVTSLTQTVGLELAPFGVRANLVSPGSTDTPMLRGMLPDEGAMARTIAGLPEQFKLGIPLRKIATPAEIAHTVLFLASDLASHITLQDLVVDGGATLSA